VLERDGHECSVVRPLGPVAAPHRVDRPDGPVSKHVHLSEKRVVSHVHEEVPLAHVLEDNVADKLLEEDFERLPLGLGPGVSEAPGLGPGVEIGDPPRWRIGTLLSGSS